LNGNTTDLYLGSANRLFSAGVFAPLVALAATVLERNMAARSIRRSAACALTYLLASVVLLVVAKPQARAAEGFRIETKIFVGEEKKKEKDKKEEEPVSSTTTLFLDGVVYDFLAKPEQTAVFRKPSGDKPGRFILLDDKNRVQTEISTTELNHAISKLKDWASRQTDPFLQFSADPKFDETFDRATGKLVLTSKLQSYTVQTKPTQHQEALVDYREYLDWYTRLNTLLTAGNPPGPRLQLNDSLARHKVVPEKIELKRAGEDPKRAEHDFTWRLSQDDLQRIDEVRAALSTYRKVDNQEYLQTSASQVSGK